MMGTMMGNISRNETIARIQQNPQLMQYFMQMSQAMTMMQMPSFQATPPVAQNQQQQQSAFFPAPQSSSSSSSWQASAAAPSAVGSYVSSNPDKNPFVQMKMGNKPMITPTENYFAGFT